MGTPWFQVWAWNVDWRKARLPPELEEGYVERLHHLAELGEDPASVSPRLLRRMVESPRFVSYAMYVAPKQNGFRPRPGKVRQYQLVRPRI